MMSEIRMLFDTIALVAAPATLIAFGATLVALFFAVRHTRQMRDVGRTVSSSEAQLGRLLQNATKANEHMGELLMSATLANQQMREVLHESRSIAFFPDFHSTMEEITQTMTKYVNVPLEHCYIVTDLLGYGHFSFPEPFETYKAFLACQRKLRMTVLTDRGLDKIGEMWVGSSLDPKDREAMCVKVKRYCDKYCNPNIEALREFTVPGSRMVELASRVNEPDFLISDRDKTRRYSEDRSLIVEAIRSTERYLHREMKRTLERGTIFRSDSASSIHIWYFTQNEVIFALTDFSGMKVRGFRSERPELNAGLRAIAEGTIHTAEPADAGSMELRVAGGGSPTAD